MATLWQLSDADPFKLMCLWALEIAGIINNAAPNMAEAPKNQQGRRAETQFFKVFPIIM